MLQDPCEVCRSASTCRLKLNCSRYLRYKEAQREQAEDEENLQRCRIIAFTTPQFATEAFRKQNEKAALEHPWKPAADVMATYNRIDPVRAQQLYAEGLTDLEMAECLGVSQMAVCKWRKKQDLRPNKKSASAQIETTTTTLPEPAQEEETIMSENLTTNPAMEAAKGAMQRIVDLQKLRSEKDSPTVRGLFIDLSTNLLKDELMALETEDADNVHLP